MSYVVVWEPSAERDLTELWLSSRIRHDLNLAANQIDIDLAHHPQDCGESRDEDRRVMFVWPLGVSYRVDESHREVRITSVWRI